MHFSHLSLHDSGARAVRLCLFLRIFGLGHRCKSIPCTLVLVRSQNVDVLIFEAVEVSYVDERMVLLLRLLLWMVSRGVEAALRQLVI